VSSPLGNRQDQGVVTGTIGFRPVDTPRASIIVTGWRSAPYLIDCLRSLETRIRSVPFEVIVSLNEPTPSLLGAIGREVDGIELLVSSVNRGFGGACNRGCAAARGDLLVLLNDDAIVLDGWLESLVTAADQHEEAGAVGSRIRLENGDLQEAGAVIWADGGTTQIGSRHGEDTPADLDLRRVDYCSAASLLVKRATWDSSGGIDPGYFPAYFEDVDLCMKIQAGGQTILYQPRSTVVHRDGASTSLAYRHFLAERNRRRFAARWSPALSLFEPPERDSPEATARAAKLGACRPLPLPGPLPLIDDPPELAGDTDKYYLRRQIDILMEHAAALEDDTAAKAATLSQLEAGLAEHAEEIHRLHHEAAALQSDMAAQQSRMEELEAELTVFTHRGRYRLIDKTYDIATSIPGFQRSLQWADARHRARMQRRAGD
jgi:GT2 family glycosyltransferase